MSVFRRPLPTPDGPDEALLSAFHDAGIDSVDDAVVAYADSPPILMPAELSPLIRHRLVSRGGVGLGVWEALVGPTPGKLLDTVAPAACRLFQTHRDYDEYFFGESKLWISRRDRPRLATWLS